MQTTTHFKKRLKLCVKAHILHRPVEVIVQVQRHLFLCFVMDRKTGHWYYYQTVLWHIIKSTGRLIRQCLINVGR